jgi:hypothetical protein
VIETVDPLNVLERGPLGNVLIALDSIGARTRNMLFARLEAVIEWLAISFFCIYSDPGASQSCDGRHARGGGF